MTGRGGAAGWFRPVRRERIQNGEPEQRMDALGPVRHVKVNDATLTGIHWDWRSGTSSDLGWGTYDWGIWEIGDRELLRYGSFVSSACTLGSVGASFAASCNT